MTKAELDLNRNIVRVGMNLGVLLDIGLFPGKHSLGVEECKGFVKSIVDDANAKMGALTTPDVAPVSMPPAEAIKA